MVLIQTLNKTHIEGKFLDFLFTRLFLHSHLPGWRPFAWLLLSLGVFIFGIYLLKANISLLISFLSHRYKCTVIARTGAELYRTLTPNMIVIVTFPLQPFYEVFCSAIICSLKERKHIFLQVD